MPRAKADGARGERSRPKSDAALPIERLAAPPNKFEWPERLARRIGKESDSRLAKSAGVAITTVREERIRRGIPAYGERRPVIEWTEEMIARLGQAIDREVAEELGVAVKSVYYKRRMLRISSHRPPRHQGSPFWTRTRLAQLGTRPDYQLAKVWGIGAGTVSHRRRVLGIPPFEPRPLPIEWDDAMRARLGREPDQQVADRLAIGLRAVREKRRRLSIPPYRPHRPKVVRKAALRPILEWQSGEVVAKTGLSHPTVVTLRKELGVAAPPRPSAWSADALTKLGRVPDEELAAELGLAPGTVRQKRCLLGMSKRRTRRWTPEEDALVRSLPPERAAAKIGRSLRAVQMRKHRLEPSSRRRRTRRWTPEEEALVRSLPPERAAAKIGRSLRAVQRRKHLLEPSSRRPSRWSAEVIALLGTLSDGELAECLGIARATVCQRRLRLGIAAYQGRRRARRGRPKGSKT